MNGEADQAQAYLVPVTCVCDVRFPRDKRIPRDYRDRRMQVGWDGERYFALGGDEPAELTGYARDFAEQRLTSR